MDPELKTQFINYDAEWIVRYNCIEDDAVGYCEVPYYYERAYFLSDTLINDTAYHVLTDIRWTAAVREDTARSMVFFRLFGSTISAIAIGIMV